jgi:hypothetical protein
MCAYQSIALQTVESPANAIHQQAEETTPESIPERMLQPPIVLVATPDLPVTPSLSQDDDGYSSSEDSYLSYFDDDQEEEEQNHGKTNLVDRAQKEQQREAILEAAGLTVRRPPPGVPGPRKNRRPAPRRPPPATPNVAQIGPTNTAAPVSPNIRSDGPESPNLDAYDRYEAYLEKAKNTNVRARSHSDVRTTATSVVSPRLDGPGFASPSQPTFSGGSVPKEGKLSGLMTRMGATQAPEKRSTSAISGPVSVVRLDAAENAGTVPGPATWSSLVDAQLLENITPQERKHQEVSLPPIGWARMVSDRCNCRLCSNLLLLRARMLGIYS